MILRFPHLDALRMAVTSGVVPAEVAAAPAQAALGPDGEVWVEPAGKLARGPLKQLKALGVENPWSAGRPLTEPLLCWHQLLPLAPDPRGLELTGNTPVLFWLEDAAALPELVAEILRLGNDRQGFRFVGDGGRTGVLLRVIGPPYYTLLRAVERREPSPPAPLPTAGEGSIVPSPPAPLPESEGRRALPAPAVCALVEARARVWVEIGHRHPLAERLAPPPGKLLMLRPPRRWTLVDEGELRDVYQMLDYELPAPGQPLRAIGLEQRLAVPLRLTDGGDEPAELWVLREGAVEQLDGLVGEADDQLLARLAFAVGERDGRTSVVLRARPSREPPPVLVLKAQAFRPYLKLPNLFVPCGRRLHPPLRRSAVAGLLAADKGQITWLYPEAQGRFTPEGLPDAAFRPLADWVDYTLDRAHAPLQAWIDACRFDFEPFVCKDDSPGGPSPKRGQGEKREGQAPAATTPQKPYQGGTEVALAPLEPPPETPPAEPPGRRAAPVGRDALFARLHEIEKQFLGLQCPLESAERAGLWGEMGGLNGALGRHLDAGLCWASAVWEQDPPPRAAVRAWYDAARKREGFAAAGEDLDRLLAETSPLSVRLLGLAEYVIASARAESPPRQVAERLGRIARCLEQHESLLPVRVAWLAWRAVAELSGGDVLALARARDRLLERLYRYGLQAEVDVPGFVRTAGMADRESVEAAREHLDRLRKLVGAWIREPAASSTSRTREYAELVFAFALARLGDAAAAQGLLEQTRQVLTRKGQVHRWVWEAFQFRVRQALGGQAGEGRLDPELLGQLETMDRLDRYVADRLRQHSRILEPHERIEAYRHWRRYTDDLSRRINVLLDINDRKALGRELDALFVLAKGADVSRQAWLAAAALEAAPRLGEAHARALLARVPPLLAGGIEPAAQQRLLEKALLVAGHFDLADEVQSLLGRLFALVEGQDLRRATEAMESLLSECLRGLRKMGMRDEVGRLLAHVARRVREGPARAKGKTPPAGAGDDGRAAPLGLLLLVAGGWMYFGQRDEAMAVLDEARTALLGGGLKPVEQTRLACAYVRALATAPPRLAAERIEELFGAEKGPRGGAVPRLRNIRDTYTTSSHFSLAQYDLVEAAVTALAGEGSGLGAEGRRWLDEDEFLVRRRIHRDVRAALGEGGA